MIKVNGRNTEIKGTTFDVLMEMLALFIGANECGIEKEHIQEALDTAYMEADEVEESILNSDVTLSELFEFLKNMKGDKDE